MAARNTHVRLECAENDESCREKEVYHEPNSHIRPAREIDHAEHTTWQNDSNARSMAPMAIQMTLDLIQQAREERDAFLENEGLFSGDDSSNNSSESEDEESHNDGTINSEDEEEFDGWMSYFGSLEGD